MTLMRRTSRLVAVFDAILYVLCPCPELTPAALWCLNEVGREEMHAETFPCKARDGRELWLSHWS
jgi:hypothetical protein